MLLAMSKGISIWLCAVWATFSSLTCAALLLYLQRSAQSRLLHCYRKSFSTASGAFLKTEASQRQLWSTCSSRKEVCWARNSPILLAPGDHCCHSTTCCSVFPAPFTHLPHGAGDVALQELCQPCMEEMAPGEEGPDGSPYDSTALCGLAALPYVH